MIGWNNLTAADGFCNSLFFFSACTVQDKFSIPTNLFGRVFRLRIPDINGTVVTHRRTISGNRRASRG